MKKGFTLIEIIVALMIFSIVGVVALTALVRIIDANKKAQTIQDAVIGMSFTMESMTRELRTGSKYLCKTISQGFDLTIDNGNTITQQNVTGCTGQGGGSATGVGFAFFTSQYDGTCPLINAYEIIPNVSGGAADGTYSFKKASQNTCAEALSFTPVLDTDSVTINNFYVQARNADYPLLFIKMDGTAGTKESVKTYFSIQTAASPRLP